MNLPLVDLKAIRQSTLKVGGHPASLCGNLNEWAFDFPYALLHFPRMKILFFVQCD